MTCGDSWIKSRHSTVFIGSGSRGMLVIRRMNAVINSQAKKFRNCAEIIHPNNLLNYEKLSWQAESQTAIKQVCSKPRHSVTLRTTVRTARENGEPQCDARSRPKTAQAAPAAVIGLKSFAFTLEVIGQEPSSF